LYSKTLEWNHMACWINTYLLIIEIVGMSQIEYIMCILYIIGKTLDSNARCASAAILVKMYWNLKLIELSYLPEVMVSYSFSISLTVVSWETIIHLLQFNNSFLSLT